MYIDIESKPSTVCMQKKRRRRKIKSHDRCLFFRFIFTLAFLLLFFSFFFVASILCCVFTKRKWWHLHSVPLLQGIGRLAWARAWAWACIHFGGLCVAWWTLSRLNRCLPFCTERRAHAANIVQICCIFPRCIHHFQLNHFYISYIDRSIFLFRFRCIGIAWLISTCCVCMCRFFFLLFYSPIAVFIVAVAFFFFVVCYVFTRIETFFFLIFVLTASDSCTLTWTGLIVAGLLCRDERFGVVDRL